MLSTPALASMTPAWTGTVATGSVSSMSRTALSEPGPVVNAAFREWGVLPRCRTESSAGAGRSRRPDRPPRARHRDPGRLAGDYLLSLAGRTSRPMAVAIGGIEVRLAREGAASRVAG